MTILGFSLFTWFHVLLSLVMLITGFVVVKDLFRSHIDGTLMATFLVTGVLTSATGFVFPFDRLTLGSYWLADARVGYAIRPGIEIFARASNLLDQRYQDVFTYRTEPRAIYAGLMISR